MKKILLLTLISLMSFTTILAQQGDFTLATKVTGLDLVFGKNDKMNFNVGLVGAYFITEKTVVDAGLAYQHEDKGANWAESSIFQFGAGIRYYFWKTCSWGFAYQGEKLKDEDLLNYLQFNAGIDIFISEKAFITPGIFYNIGLSEEAEYSYGFSLAIGLKF